MRTCPSESRCFVMSKAARKSSIEIAQTRLSGWPLARATAGVSVLATRSRSFAESQSGGFSPGVAARVFGASGEAAFVKAVSAEANPRTPDLHRDEARFAALLPADSPSPRLLGVVDEAPWVSRIAGTHRAEIGGFTLAPGAKRVVVVATLDNLLKGAATQAMQNLNRALGFDETAGIPLEKE